jgi:fatty-acyl-CoA synthase
LNIPRKEDSIMGEQEMFLRTIQDLEAIEHVPLAARLTIHSTYELIREAATKDPERTAITLLSGRSRSDRPVRLSYRALINNIHQTANLLADLGIEPENVIALLLPDLPETHLLLWGGQAAGIVCPIDFGCRLSRSSHSAWRRRRCSLQRDRR